MIKVGLLTKMAGNYKKLNNMGKCVEASVNAFVLIQKIVGPEDPQTCRCLVNLGTVYQYFERNDDAKDKYRQYINMFQANPAWANQKTYADLNDYAEAEIAEIDGVGGGDEYYDEEEGKEDEEEEKEEEKAQTNASQKSSFNSQAAPTKSLDNVNDESNKIKLVLVGDTSVGKSCMVTNYLHNSYSDDYEPTVLDVYKGVKNVAQHQLSIEIHDTSGDEHLGVNRRIQYGGADVFMICAAANRQDSFENIGKWRAEIMQACPQIPILLILTKSDLLDMTDENEQVTFDMIKQKS